jgi:hypothetical protein
MKAAYDRAVELLVYLQDSLCHIRRKPEGQTTAQCNFLGRRHYLGVYILIPQDLAEMERMLPGAE